MREGNYMLIETGSRVVRWAYSDVVRTLRELGGHIARRASEFAVAAPAVHAWHARDNASVETLEQISMGVCAARLETLRGALPPRSRAEILRGVDEVRAAARMLDTRVSDEVLTGVIEKIRAEPRRETPTLRQWFEKALAELESSHLSSPRLQGRHMARWLRRELGSEEDRVSPERLLADWGVALIPFATERHIEAIAFWGPSHGPAIFRNPNSKRSGHRTSSRSLSGGERFTLAHELAHLLVDTDGALPVAEVLGGRLPRAPEERANAFAAEFLLPERIAGVAYQRGSTIHATLGELTRKFAVTKTLAAFQILKRFGENSPVLNAADLSTLQDIVRLRRQQSYQPA